MFLVANTSTFMTRAREPHPRWCCMKQPINAGQTHTARRRPFRGAHPSPPCYATPGGAFILDSTRRRASALLVMYERSTDPDEWPFHSVV